MTFLVEVNGNSKKDGKATKGRKQQEGEKKKGRKNHGVQSEAENG